MKECIDQLLHGYRHGHRRLAGSTQLSDSSERLVLRLSDLSGSRPVGGFESYLTGFPLPCDEVYALARTWLADDVERPGCVWTHTLLVPLEHFADRASLRGLLERFSRPMPAIGFEAYANPLTLPPPTYDSLVAPSKRNHAFTIIEAFYAHPNAPVAVGANDAGELERIVFEIWLQQWASLRSTVSFSTGSLEPREVDSTPMDLQVFPSRLSVWHRRFDEAGGVIADPHGWESMQDSPESQSWASIAVRQLVHPSEQFMHLLDDFGAASHSRGSFAGLTELCDLMLHGGRKSDVERACFLMEDIYPSASIGLDAKRTFLQESTLTRTFGQKAALTTLRALSTTKRADSWADIESADLLPLAQAAWSKSQPKVIELLEGMLNHDNLSSASQTVLGALIDGMEPRSTPALVRSSSVALQYVIMRHRPALSSLSPDLWHGPPEVIANLARGLTAAESASSDDYSSMVSGLLAQSGNWILADIAEQIDGKGLDAILDAATTNPDAMPAQLWVSLKGRQDSVVSWFHSRESKSPENVAVIARVLDLDGTAAKQLDPLQLICGIESTVTPSSSVEEAAVFCFALGLRQVAGASDVLLIATFPMVHTMAAENRLRWSRHWRSIDEALPQTSWWRSWDTCHRLRLAIVRRAIAEDWSRAMLEGVSQSPFVQREFYQLIHEEPGGAQWIQQRDFST
jgi:hypothetical protein